MKPIFGYWDARGLATPIRLLLHHVNVDYEEKLYKCGPPPDFDRSEWLNDKFNLGLDFPNLPYYIDDDVKLTQSSAILHYLARKHGLVGKNPVDESRCHVLAEHVRDHHMKYAMVVYNPDFEKLKDDYLKSLPEKIKGLSDFLGDAKFVAGDYVTYADFVLFEFLEGQMVVDKDLLKNFPNLDQYHKRILALESVDRYFKSPGAIKYPFNGAPARIGGPYSDQLK